MPREARLAQIKEDLAEYNRLLQQAQRQRVKDILHKQIKALTAEQTKIEKEIEQQTRKAQEQKAQQQKPIAEQPTNPASNIIYTALTKYSWEDETRKVKIYFSLENIGNECPANNIDIEFKQNSVELKLRNYRKQNLIFSIKKTFGQIIPEQCQYLAKTNLLSITLTKKSSGTWTQLNFKEDKFKSEKKETKEDFSDPNASIMNMMKKMYEDGDETMKKTIAEAWTKSRDNKGQDAFKFD